MLPVSSIIAFHPRFDKRGAARYNRQNNLGAQKEREEYAEASRKAGPKAPRMV